MKTPSQNDRILAVLKDGREHEMRDIHRIAGFCRLNSRISELRSRGHVISCRREGGNYFYQLAVGALDEPDTVGGAGGVSGSSSASIPANPLPRPTGRGGALTLFNQPYVCVIDESAGLAS